MNTKTCLYPLLLLISAVALTGCGKTEQTQPANVKSTEMQAIEKNASESMPVSTDETNQKTSLTIADPLDYSAATPDDALGINENDKGLEVGSVIPQIELKDIEGQPFVLSDSWAEQPALIVFYRGGWCPYCNLQVRELSTHYDQLSEAGVQPVLISVDTPDNTALLDAKYEIPFPVLSDPDLAAHTAFNVLLTLDAETLKKYEEYGIDLAAWSGKNHNTIAVASAFIIGQDGKVLFSHAPSDYSSRPSVEQLLTIISDTLQ